jgi:hypothetical protein
MTMKRMTVRNVPFFPLIPIVPVGLVVGALVTSIRALMRVRRLEERMPSPA